MAVWDFNTGKMLASSYTLDKINDIKVGQSVYMSDRVFEFCTVGRDQVQFWAFVKDFKTEFRLEYYDVFIKKVETSYIKNLDGFFRRRMKLWRSLAVII